MKKNLLLIALASVLVSSIGFGQTVFLLLDVLWSDLHVGM